MPKRSVLIAASLVLLSGQALADPSACLMCHGANEFEGMEPADVQEALADPGLPPHSPFAELSVEEVKALLEALAP